MEQRVERAEDPAKEHPGIELPFFSLLSGKFVELGYQAAENTLFFTLVL